MNILHITPISPVTMRGRKTFVYIVANSSKMMYVGCTSNIKRRIRLHKKRAYGGYTARFNLNKLVLLEQFEDLNTAITRQREIARLSKSKKIRLVETKNPNWADLPCDEDQVTW